MNFGDILRKLRTEQGIRQKQLALTLQISESTISKYENNIYFPDLDTLCKIAGYFHVSTDYLLDRTEYRFPIGELNRELINIYAKDNIINILLRLPPESRQYLLQYLSVLGLQD